MSRLYHLPHFLSGLINREQYMKWLQRKAAAHVLRDRHRTGTHIQLAHYKRKIHAAVCESNGIDWYTGEALRWDQISKYNNEQSKQGRSVYKATFALLPSVDHVANDNGEYDFVICAWRTNDAKNDLSLADFVQLCRKVVDRHEAKSA